MLAIFYKNMLSLKQLFPFPGLLKASEQGMNLEHRAWPLHQQFTSLAAL